MLFQKLSKIIPTIKAQDPKVTQCKDIIDSLVNSVSTVVVGPTRSGKTLFVKALLGEIILENPDTQVFISAAVNSQWFGLDADRLYVGNYQKPNAAAAIDDVFDIYEQRLFRESDNNNNTPPITLVIDDFGVQCLNMIRHQKGRYIVTVKKLNALVTNGLTCNIRVVISTSHADLSSDVLRCYNYQPSFNYVALTGEYGDLKSFEQFLKNRFILSSSDRLWLEKQIKTLRNNRKNNQGWSGVLVKKVTDCPVIYHNPTDFRYINKFLSNLAA